MLNQLDYIPRWFRRPASADGIIGDSTMAKIKRLTKIDFREFPAISVPWYCWRYEDDVLIRSWTGKGCLYRPEDLGPQHTLSNMVNHTKIGRVVNGCYSATWRHLNNIILI
jgi:hypothetical protein